ncbi:unnamed protein product, partial [Prorocentrum cordatum]
AVAARPCLGSSPPPRPRRPARLGGRVAMRGAAGPGEAEQAHQKMVRAEASEVLAIRGTAEEGLRSLGWSFASLPKQGPVGRVVANAVHTGGWAEKLGVQVGDRLALINGEPPNWMEPKMLFAIMKSRPLELTFHRAKGHGSGKVGSSGPSRDA